MRESLFGPAEEPSTGREVRKERRIRKRDNESEHGAGVSTDELREPKGGKAASPLAKTSKMSGSGEALPSSCFL